MTAPAIEHEAVGLITQLFATERAKDVSVAG